MLCGGLIPCLCGPWHGNEHLCFELTRCLGAALVRGQPWAALVAAVSIVLSTWDAQFSRSLQAMLL